MVEAAMPKEGKGYVSKSCAFLLSEYNSDLTHYFLRRHAVKVR